MPDLSEPLSEMFCETVQVDPVRCQQSGATSVSVIEMSYTQSDAGHDGPRTSTRIRQTAVVLEDPELDLPQITLWPRWKGLAGKMMTLIGAVQGIDFPESPQFEKEYQLHAWNEPAARVLFTPKARDYFAANPGWSLRGNGKRLVVFKQNQVCPDGELNEFVERSLQILTLMQESEEELDQRPEVHRETTPEDLVQAADRMSGVAGMMLRSQLRKIGVTTEQLDAFVRQPPPRSAPRGMRRQVIGDQFVLMVVGAVFLIAGIVGAVLAVTLGVGKERLVAIPIGLVFPLIGGMILSFSIRHQSRTRRLLRDGKVAEGKISDVKRTEVEVNNARRYHVHFEYLDGGETRSAIANVYANIEKARQLKSTGKVVRLLVDPVDPDHVLCLDLLVVFEG